MKSKTVCLSDLAPGQGCVVVNVQGGGETRRRMLDMGLVKGAEVTMIRKAPLGDPIEFEVCGYNLSLRKQEADLITVERTS